MRSGTIRRRAARDPRDGTSAAATVAGATALLSGWGRTPASAARVVAARDEEDVARVLAGAGPRGVVARGLGRSYGDAAQRAGGTVLDMRAVGDVGDVDPGTGEVDVGAGVSLDELVRTTLPSGWFLPVTPGTRQVTVGGAVAADVHGKNHHVAGGFMRHVLSVRLLTPSGAVTVAPDTDAPLFWATGGGMGMTGVVTRARVAMLAVETDKVLVDTERHTDLDAVMASMEGGDDAYRYSVAWVDCIGGRGGGRHAGRAVLTRGDHARAADVGGEHHGRAGALAPPPRARLRAPRHVPGRLLNPLSVAAFNEAWYRKAPRRRVGELQSLWTFFHPLDGVADWNLLYGPSGFVQYQFVVGPDRGDVVAAAVRELADRRLPSFLAVLKRFGPSNPGPLSFPMPGWTLALDLPLGPPGLAACLDRLDEEVAAAGGRVYLAKDARLRPELLGAMYPRLGELAEVRRRVDPAGILRSDLAVRLGIV